MLAIRGKAFWLWVILVTVLVVFAAAQQKSIDASEAKAGVSPSSSSLPNPKKSNLDHEPN